jgi:DNA-binding FadR family transcriptional regulator
MNERHEIVPPTWAGGRAPTAPNDRRRLHGSIAHDLAVAIVGGHYKPGDVLPNEDVFSQRLAVSRTAYREAVRILAAKGLVESRPKTGTRICERSRWNTIDPDVLAWHLEAEPSEGFIRQLFELRRIVEPPAAALAAQRRTENDLGAMRSALAVMGMDRLNTEAGMLADLDFHHAILVAARNEPLAALSSGIGATIRWTNMFKQREGALPRDVVADHVRVYDAIAASDPEAARLAMTALVDDALETTRKALKRARPRSPEDAPKMKPEERA